MTGNANGEDTMEAEAIESISGTVRSDVRGLNILWKAMGLSEKNRFIYFQMVHAHIKDLLSDMLTETKKKKDAVFEGVQLLKEQKNSLLKELQIDEVSEQEPDYEHLPLIDVQDRLKFQIKKLKKVKDKRLEILKKLREEEEVMCKKLGTKPINREKEGLSLTFIEKFSAELQHEKRKMEVNEKREELEVIWSYLEESEDFCKAFLRQNSSYDDQTIAALQAEIKRCKDKRSKNIKKYVPEVRDEIEVLWVLCWFSESQKKAFLDFLYENYTEELLSVLDLEAKKLRKFHRRNEKIFDLLEERETLCKKMKELDNGANDSDPEEEEKKFKKELRFLEQQLLLASEEFRLQNGEIFTVSGLPMNDFLDFSKTQYREEKENMKMAKFVLKVAQSKSARKTPLTISKSGGAIREPSDDSSPETNVDKKCNVSGKGKRPTVISSEILPKKSWVFIKSNTPSSQKMLKFMVKAPYSPENNLKMQPEEGTPKHLEEPQNT